MSDNSVDIPLKAWGAVVSQQLALLDETFLATENEDERLHGYVVALGFLINSCKSFPGFEGGTEILSDLLLKLDQITKGTPAIRPLKRSGRPKQGWADAVMQGRACAGVDALIEWGDSEDAACKLVADALAKAGVRGRQGKPLSAKTVRDWRSRAATYGDKEDAKFIRDHVNVLRPLLSVEGITTMQRRRVVAKFVSTGAAVRAAISG